MTDLLAELREKIFGRDVIENCSHPNLCSVWPRGEARPRMYCHMCGFVRAMTDEEMADAKRFPGK